MQDLQLRLRYARHAHKIRDELQNSRRLSKRIAKQSPRQQDRLISLEAPDTSQNRVEICKRLLRPLSPGDILDLGCGHGKFSLAAHEMGWNVTAVDARTERMPENAKWIKWVRSDVREFEIGSYDCILLLGLLYHLPVDDQLTLLGKCRRAAPLTILDTHTAGRRKLVKRNGYKGSLYREPGKATSSWGNKQSFWATYPELVRMCNDAGFSTVAPFCLLTPKIERSICAIPDSIPPR